MGFNQPYQLIKEVGDGKDEFQHSEPQHTYQPVVTSWWKFLLCNLLAAGVGAGVTYAISHGSFTTHSTSPSDSVAAVADSIAPSTTSAISSTSLSLTSSASTSISTSPATPTYSIEHIEANPLPETDLTGIILDCGYSPEEARAKGCVYDVMMQDWVPEPCYDSVLTERYLAEGNWTWYADGDGNTTISDEQMRKGEHGAAWMSTSYHKAHCVFSWLKIIRALRLNRGISQELLSYDHVLHCKHGALKGDDNDRSLGVRAPTNYAKCALYDTWLQAPIPDKHDSAER